MGWCIGWHSQVAFPPNGLVAVPIRDFHVPWGVELAYRADEARGPVLEVIQALRRAAHDVYTSMAPQENKYWSEHEATA